MIDIGKKIKTLRQQKGWSQGDAAALLKISVPAFSKIEADITGVNLSRLEEIAKIFDVTIADLILAEGEKTPEYRDELKAAKDTIDQQSAKINHLQEYVITLYEELLRFKKQAATLT